MENNFNCSYFNRILISINTLLIIIIHYYRAELLVRMRKTKKRWSISM